ncbi:MAG: glycosyltransferase family 2 protein [Chloroflexota bacterium]
MSNRVTCIVPVWNEAEVIERVLREVPPGQCHEIVVVDGGSTDGTREIAAKCGARVVVQQRRGYGAACAEGAQAADGDVLVFFDGDYSDPPGEIGRVVGPILRDEADLVLGCRDLSRARNALPLHQRLGNRAVAALVGGLTGAPLADLPSFKAIRREGLTALGMQEMTYGWTTEMIVKAARAGYRIEQVNVPYRPRAGGRSKVGGTLKGTVLAGFKLVQTAFRYARWRPRP